MLTTKRSACVVIGAVLCCPSFLIAWQGPFNLTEAHNPDGDYNPDLSQDSAGNLHLTYMGKYTGKWRVFHRIRTNAGQWLDPNEAAVSNNSDPFNVHSKIDTQDNLHVVWSVGGNVGFGLAGTDVFHRKRAANGSWNAAVNLSQSNNAASLIPDVAITSTGQIFVA